VRYDWLKCYCVLTWLLGGLPHEPVCNIAQILRCDWLPDEAILL